MTVLRTIIIALSFLLLTGWAQASETDSSYAAARNKMVKTQIIARGVSDSCLLKAMDDVERHLFVDPARRSEAYDDHPLPIGENQTISQPYIVALMTELLEIKPSHRILEIGTGSGYQAAILGELAAEVYTIEIIEKLGRKAEKLLQKLGYENIDVKIGDGYIGWPEKAPFDGIIVTAAPAEIPGPLLDQLAEGGRLVIPVGEYYQELILVEKRKGETLKKRIIPVRFVPMTGKAQEK
ncbi:MAG: protein-L-isoaspartate(D-aspartate) O-methyltransferase [FCB group bacterium]|nr:protein-L-isoaspartate(D-aspartate) O-methyltransferase [FCB group bacterium]